MTGRADAPSQPGGPQRTAAVRLVRPEEQCVIRDTVRDFVALGPLPSEFDPAVTVEQIERHQQALERITRPVSDEEATLLLEAFGPDGCFGLGWSLLHLIETAPHSPIETQPAADANEWLHRLWRGVQNARAMELRPDNQQ